MKLALSLGLTVFAAASIGGFVWFQPSEAQCGFCTTVGKKCNSAFECGMGCVCIGKRFQPGVCIDKDDKPK